MQQNFIVDANSNVLVETLVTITPITPPPVINLPPTANAGSDIAITLPQNTVTLSGRGSDPEGKAVSFQWTKFTGGTANILSPNSANTDVTSLTQGSYVFRLVVTDDTGQSTTDDVGVLVSAAPPPITPSKYEGYGCQATGGAGKPVLNVNSKSTFEAAIGSNRIIKFTANCSFNGRYEWNNISYLTVDGNGFDVTINNNNNGNGISMDSGCHHIILTGLRVINAGNDCINTAGDAHDIMIDHCSAYGGRDGNIDLTATSGKNVTAQWCIIGNGNSGWSGDTLVTTLGASIHHCLYAPAGSPGVQERCPFVHANYSPVGSPNCDFRNNVLVGWGRYATGVGYRATINVVNNYYATNKSGAIDTAADSNSPSVAFCAGNVQLGGANINSASNHAEWVVPDPYKITMQTAKDAANLVLAQVGLPTKNSYEQSLINSVVVQ